MPVREATLEACRLRLRPIVMTSIAFILGRGAALALERCRRRDAATLGTAVFSGMLGVTAFGIFLTPVFFYVVDGWARRRCSRPAAVAARSATLVLRQS